MRCQLIRLVLPLYVGNDLSGVFKTLTERHISHCESCTADLEKLRRVRLQIHQLANLETSGLPENFAQMMRQQVALTNGEKTSFARKKKWIYATAAAILIASLSWFNNWQNEKLSETVPNTMEMSAQTTEEPEEDFTDGDFEGLLSLLHPNRALTDAELDAKYPVVENIDFPAGTNIVYHTGDPNTKIVWVFPQEGARLQ